MKTKLLVLFAAALAAAAAQAAEPPAAVLRAEHFKGYIDRFNSDDDELYAQYVPNDAAWEFLLRNIPFFDCPDRDVMTTYYFRWWTFRKHIKHTPAGFIFTEFLPPVRWAGKYNSICCPAAHHIMEGRWLRDGRFVDDYARFWFTEGDPRLYSFWAAAALWEYYKAARREETLELLPTLVENFLVWEKGWTKGGHFTGRNPDGLYSTHDARDGMEMQIGGSGKRPAINSYMYGDAAAIACMAERTGRRALARQFRAKAERIRRLVEERLWDDSAAFFKTRSEDDDRLVGVRELQGYTPWYFNLPTQGRGYEAAWQFLGRADGFDAPYGLTTAEQSHPLFRISYEGHECQWNGPVWPFATSVTLTALANVLNNYRQQAVGKDEYFRQFLKYARSHRLVRGDGRIVPWIDENLNPYTGDWISRTRLASWENGTWSDSKGGRERGKDYNHSTYCDLLITGLVGIRPQASDGVVIHPLIPDGAWEWFCLDGVPYQGRTLTVLYDRTGRRYGRGQGFIVLVDGEIRSHTPHIRPVRIAF